jgi:hypothetical protein
MNSNKIIYTPFTYLIGWSKHNKWYYGVRYGKGCHPNDLWKTYFTSSKYVKAFREEHGEPDIIQIRRTFDCGKKALLWEETTLRKLKAVQREDWLNRAAGGRGYTMLDHKHSEESKRKMSEARKNNPKCIAAAKVTAEKLRGKKHTEETKEKIRLNHKNSKAVQENMARLAVKRTGKKRPKEFGEKMSKILKGREITWVDKISESLKGNNRRSMKIEYKGKIYNSKKELRELNKIGQCKLETLISKGIAKIV